MAKRGLIFAVFVCLVLCLTVTAQTLINLTTQVQGILPVGNGGTGASSLAGAHITVDGAGTTTAGYFADSTTTAHTYAVDTNLDDGKTTANTLTYGGSGGLATAQVNLTGSGPWTVASTPGSCATSASSKGELCMSSSANNLVYGYNGGTNESILTGDIASQAGTPRLQQQVLSLGTTTPAETTSSLLGIMYVTKAITVRAAWLFTEVVASSCSTEPAYAVYYNTSVSTSGATEISSSSCTAAATTLGATSCGITATSVPAADYVFWEVKTAPSTCADKVRLVYEYTMN